MSICSNNEEEDESRNNIFSIYNFITFCDCVFPLKKINNSFKI